MRTSARLLLCLLCAAASDAFGAFVRGRSGAGLANATAARDQFRADLGGARREINWDDVPDSFAAPSLFPPNFFNVNSPRGVIFSTPGTGFQVSASAASGTPVRFGNIDPAYPAEFVAFSPERLFTPLGSAVTDIAFFVPGTTTPAGVSSFGAMFTDVDFGNTVIQLFGPSGEDYGSLNPPLAPSDVSFIGITFVSGEKIARVRITSTRALGPGQHDVGFPPFPALPYTALDVVAIDDLIYSEPAEITSGPSIPAMSPLTLAFLGLALAGIAAFALRS